jgi:hypothetical protein
VNELDTDVILLRLDKRELELFHLGMAEKRIAHRAGELTETIRCKTAVAKLRQAGGVGILLKDADGNWALARGRTLFEAEADEKKLLRSHPHIREDMRIHGGTRTIIGA